MRSIPTNALLSGHWSPNLLIENKGHMAPYIISNAPEQGSKSMLLHPAHSGHMSSGALSSLTGTNNIMFPMGVVMFAVIIGTASVLVAFVAYRYLSAVDSLNGKKGNAKQNLAANTNFVEQKQERGLSNFFEKNKVGALISQSQTSQDVEVSYDWASDESDREETGDDRFPIGGSSESLNDDCGEINRGRGNLMRNGGTTGTGYENVLPELTDLRDRVPKLADAKSKQSEEQQSPIVAKVSTEVSPRNSMTLKRQLVQQEFIIGHPYYPISPIAQHPAIDDTAVLPTQSSPDDLPTYTSSISFPITRYPLIPIPTSTINDYNSNKSKLQLNSGASWEDPRERYARGAPGEPPKTQLVTCLSQDADVYYENEEDDEIFL